MSPERPTALRKGSVVVAGHRTSISLEDAFWQALAEVARAQDRSINSLVSEIDSGRSGNLSSAVRVYLLEWFRRASAPRAI
ncbi:MAG: ribbon-helix-helix domain-containing protein [Alphaproteobacteria bacterium]|nr:ribbon-helix-helix domain-containing protein [Alphaproteobacteria bacterium]